MMMSSEYHDNGGDDEDDNDERNYSYEHELIFISSTQVTTQVSWLLLDDILVKRAYI